MESGGKTKFYLDKIKVTVQGATQKALEALAFQIEGQTKVNITTNNQVDTGFMLNSVYTLTPEGQRSSTWENGEYLSQKTGEKVARQAVAAPSLNGAAAAVGVGAEYAIFQEAANSFLYRAGEQIAPQAGGVMEPIYKELVRD
jgi:hypothetical protein